MSRGVDAAPAVVLRTPALLWMALACGLCAGGNYFNQPLLHSIAQHFAVADAQVGWSVTVAQVSYAYGLMLLVPLGDTLERRGLAVGLMLLAALGQALAGWAPSLAVFMAGTLVAGLFSVAAQVLVPMAAALAAPGHSGRNVGTVMSGLLVGILLARSVAGLLSGWGGWALVYQCASVAMALVALALWRLLPTSYNPQPVAYRAALGSMLQLLRSQPALRRRTLASSLAFASVSVLFATMALVLSGPDLALSDSEIGLVGLAGVAGALVAQVAGRWADQGRGLLLVRAGAVITLLAWLPLWWGAHSLAWFVVGLVAIDLGLQAVNVTNQSAVASLLPAARSRMNAVYMTGYFVGGAGGSALGIAMWQWAGWQGACALGAGLAVLSALTVFNGVRVAQRQALARAAA